MQFIPPRRMLAAILFAAAVLMLPAPAALANPWPQEKGRGFVISTLRYYRADVGPADRNPARGGGTFQSWSLYEYGEYGLTDATTLGFNLGFEDASVETLTGTDRHHGMNLAEGFLRQVVWRDGDAVLAVQGLLKLPAGDRDENPPVGDDQVDAELRLLYGRGLDLRGWSGFLNVEGAYRYRADDPSDQLRATTTLGLHVAQDWMALFQIDNLVSRRGTGPGGWDYDLHTVSLSAVRDLSETWGLQLGVSDDVASRNHALGQAVFAAVWMRF